MRDKGDKRDFGLVIGMLCLLTGWSWARLSQESGVDKDLISDYVRGLKSPTRATRERLAAAFGVSYAFLEQLIPVGRGVRVAFESAALSEAKIPLSFECAPRLEEKLTGAMLEAMAPFLLQMPRSVAARAPSPDDRAWAEGILPSIEALSTEDRTALAHALQGDERSWALALGICDASEAAAAHSADEALRLARLAVSIADGVPGPAEWRLRLLGQCEPFLANALRVGGDLTAAEEAFVRADEHWRQGEGGDPSGLLDGTRRLDLKASLRRQQGQFAEALNLLDQALAASPPEATARLLLKKATTHSRAGDYQLAAEVLRQAKPRIDEDREPRLFFLHLFTSAVLDCHLDCYQEAEPLLPLIERLAEDLRTEMDGWRVVWLKGRIWAGLGRLDEAVETLSQVRRYFLDKKIDYDFALVSVELATLYLEQGRTRRVKELAEEMLWIFKGQKVHQEALAALALFRHAAQLEEARAEWTRSLVKYLYRAQHNPGLRFEP